MAAHRNEQGFFRLYNSRRRYAYYIALPLLQQLQRRRQVLPSAQCRGEVHHKAFQLYAVMRQPAQPQVVCIFQSFSSYRVKGNLQHTPSQCVTQNPIQNILKYTVMKYLLSLLFVFLCITGAAQETCSRIIDRATPVDTARYKVTYSLKYKFHPDQRDFLNDTRIVQIGKCSVKWLKPKSRCM